MSTARKSTALACGRTPVGLRIPWGATDSMGEGRRAAPLAIKYKRVVFPFPVWYRLWREGVNSSRATPIIISVGRQGFLQARFGGGGDSSPPPKKKISYSPPKIFTDFIFIHPEPPTPRLLPPKVLQLPPPPKGEILQETLVVFAYLTQHTD